MAEPNSISVTDRKAYQKAYREANKERLQTYQAAYREKNRERIRTQINAHYEAHKAEYIERAKVWAEQHPEKRRAARKKWTAENPEAWREICRAVWHRNKEKYLERAKVYRRTKPEVVKLAVKRWRDENPASNAHHVGLRRARRMQATPIWADLKKVKAIYQECKSVSKSTGTPHQVDHYYPLKHDRVCGLHNEFNLRIVPATENLKKKNGWPE